jgi:S-adenosylmethionine synthetase|tara:strand:+ start:3911 stop:4861 length:951 start_codon:yes stop_codon:yes gene_type:complete
MTRTAEIVTPRHPDKICDRISDAILDACLEQDPDSRVAIETMGGHGIITVTGELTTKAFVDIPAVVKKVYGRDIGVQTNIVIQSPEISQGVDTGGAGDQGIMIGYACNDNEEMVPQEYYLARKLAQRIYEEYPFDGKTQVTLLDGGKARVVASFQNTSTEKLEDLCTRFFKVLNIEIKSLHCNPAGDWSLGGFDADAGLTGRKLAVDNYGPRVPLGGGAFSGKDATKVDRSAAYMARRIAVDYLKEFNAKEVLVRLAYAIGHDQPLEATAIVDGSTSVIRDYDLSPKGIIKFLDLNKPIFSKTAEWGHMGNNFKWL